MASDNITLEERLQGWPALKKDEAIILSVLLALSDLLKQGLTVNNGSVPLYWVAGSSEVTGEYRISLGYLRKLFRHDMLVKGVKDNAPEYAERLQQLEGHFIHLSPDGRYLTVHKPVGNEKLVSAGQNSNL